MKDRAPPNKDGGGTDHRAPASQNQPRRDPRNGKIRYAKLWINEMRGRVASLSPAARGAYLSLLLEYLTQQGPLEHDDKLLIRITGVPKRDWPGIFIELLGVFDLVNGELVDEYGDRCIAEFNAASKRGRANIGHRYGVVDGLKDAQS